MPEGVTHCGQQRCGAQVLWGRTVRKWDERAGEMKGGKAMMLDWPMPDPDADPMRALEDGTPVPNLGVRRDEHATWWIRVVTKDEPIRADERPAVPHWATCKNPPFRRATAPRRPKAKPAPSGQDSLFDVTGTAPEVPPPPGLLSSANLYPRRRRG